MHTARALRAPLAIARFRAHPSPDADHCPYVGGVRPSPGADVAAASPVSAQMCYGARTSIAVAICALTCCHGWRANPFKDMRGRVRQCAPHRSSCFGSARNAERVAWGVAATRGGVAFGADAHRLARHRAGVPSGAHPALDRPRMHGAERWDDLRQHTQTFSSRRRPSPALPSPPSSSHRPHVLMPSLALVRPILARLPARHGRVP